MKRIYDILCSFLGEPKNSFDPQCYQYQFPCPRCVEDKGPREASKYNLEVNLQQCVYFCWSCESDGEGMHGKISKLIRKYGTSSLLTDYENELKSIRESGLYVLGNGEVIGSAESEIFVKLPSSFSKVYENNNVPKNVSEYLKGRGITKDIIKRYNIGYTTFEETYPRGKGRIIVPSYSSEGYLNYWVGRDYLPEKEGRKRQKYLNVKADKKAVIFNESLTDWDADILLVEGIFDSLVYPNTIPLMGKLLTRDSLLFQRLMERCNATVTIMLDSDTKIQETKKIYKTLDQGRLQGKIRYVRPQMGKDLSDIFRDYGKKGVIAELSRRKKFTEVELNFN